MTLPPGALAQTVAICLSAKGRLLNLQTKVTIEKIASSGWSAGISDPSPVSSESRAHLLWPYSQQWVDYDYASLTAAVTPKHRRTRTLDERSAAKASPSCHALPLKPRHTERNVGGVPALQGAMPNTLVPELNPARSTRTSLLLAACSTPESDTQDAQTKAGNNWPKTHNGQTSTELGRCPRHTARGGMIVLKDSSARRY